MKTRIILGIVVCALFLSTQAFALDPWNYVRTPCSEEDLYRYMGYPDRDIKRYTTGHSVRYSLYYERMSHNGKQTIIIFVGKQTNQGLRIISKSVSTRSNNPPVW